MSDDPKQPKPNDSQPVTSGRKPQIVVIPPRVVKKEEKGQVSNKMTGPTGKSLDENK
jgi:hypothetical protein